MSEKVFSSEIIFFRQKQIVACDAKCNKAFGAGGRPQVKLSSDPDDFEWLADNELGDAPQITGYTEGGQDKPLKLSEAHNKWCARQCERSVMVSPGEPIMLPDFSKRIPNIDSKKS